MNATAAAELLRLAAEHPDHKRAALSVAGWLRVGPSVFGGGPVLYAPAMGVKGLPLAEAHAAVMAEAGPVVRHPCGVDPENPEHWPWNVARPRLFVAPEPTAEEVAALASLPPIVEGQCATAGCDGSPAEYRPTTHAALEHFCERCRHNARARVSRLRQPIEVIAARMRAGVRLSTLPKGRAA